ncbi:MAG: peptidoglycan DD-metalloendopeptidase family protein [Gallionellaceae bacterium]|jgi:lipoprotein NlpD
MTVSDVKSRSVAKQIALWSLLATAAIVVAGCKTHTSRRAPIVEHGVEIRKSVSAAKAKRVVAPSGTNYVVQKGDTMYSIAFINGVEVRDVAELNSIDDPSAIKIGQQLSIPAPRAIKTTEKKQTAWQAANQSGGIKTQPKAGKIPYSATALAQAETMQEDGVAAKPEVAAAKDEDDDEEDLEWGMPSSGKVIAEFSESANRKGVDISGKQGQAVVASAPGKVVYSGSGLRGYGKLVIIKHNKTFLSAYAHNDQVLVKEGQSVTKGQKIAEMGNTDSDQVKLHFEIRKFGKPVDPAQYLPLVKS